MKAKFKDCEFVDNKGLFYLGNTEIYFENCIYIILFFFIKIYFKYIYILYIILTNIMKIKWKKKGYFSKMEKDSDTRTTSVFLYSHDGHDHINFINSKFYNINIESEFSLVDAMFVKMK